MGLVFNNNNAALSIFQLAPKDKKTLFYKFFGFAGKFFKKTDLQCFLLSTIKKTFLSISFFQINLTSHLNARTSKRKENAHGIQTASNFQKMENCTVF